jgi:hypothetical protein
MEIQGKYHYYPGIPICHSLVGRLYFYFFAFLTLTACFASLSSAYYSGILCNLTIFASHPDVSRHTQERMNNSRERVQEGGGRTLRKRKIEGSRSKARGTEAEEGPATSDPPGNHERPEAEKGVRDSDRDPPGRNTCVLVALPPAQPPASPTGPDRLRINSSRERIELDRISKHVFRSWIKIYTGSECNVRSVTVKSKSEETNYWKLINEEISSRLRPEWV